MGNGLLRASVRAEYANEMDAELVYVSMRRPSAAANEVGTTIKDVPRPQHSFKFNPTNFNFILLFTLIMHFKFSSS